MYLYILQLLGEMVNKLAPVGEGKSALGLIQYSHRDKVKIDVPLGKTKNINQFEKELRNVEQRKGK